MLRVARSLIALIVLFLAVQTTGALAQATRTWVSGVGDDANPCSRTAPCKTFAGAISKTAAAGEINVLDPGGFGGVTITKSLTIRSDSIEAGALVAGTNDIFINAGASDVVTLEGLDIEGLGSSLTGVKLISGAELVIKNCRIHGFKGAPGIGVDIEPTAGNRVLITDSLIYGNNTGILVKPAASIVSKASLERVQVFRNFTSGLTVDGATAEAQLFSSSIFANAVGLTINNSGKITTFTNNVINGNLTDGAPNNTVPLK